VEQLLVVAIISSRVVLFRLGDLVCEVSSASELLSLPHIGERIFNSFYLQASMKMLISL